MNNVEDLKKLALDQGWTVAKQGTRLRWESPDGKSSVVTGAELTNKSSFYNARSNLIRNGLELPGRKPRQAKEAPVAKQPSNNRVHVDGAPDFSNRVAKNVGYHTEVTEIIDLAAKHLTEDGRLIGEVGPVPDPDVTGLAILALEDQLKVVADAVAARARAWDDTVPALRADVRALKERPVAVPCDHEALLSKVSKELLDLKVSFDRQLAAFKAELEDTVTDLIDEATATLRAQIQAAEATVDPLAAIRKRLGQS